MIYASITDMENRFGTTEMITISDKDEGLNAINTVRVNVALEDASAEIDQYLANCYQLPLVVSAPRLRQLACDIARYRLYDSIRLTSSNNYEDHESARRYRQAIKALTEICKTALVDDNGQVIIKNAVPGISVQGVSSCLPELNCCGCD